MDPSVSAGPAVRRPHDRRTRGRPFEDDCPRTRRPGGSSRRRGSVAGCTTPATLRRWGIAHPGCARGTPQHRTSAPAGSRRRRIPVSGLGRDRHCGRRGDRVGRESASTGAHIRHSVSMPTRATSRLNVSAPSGRKLPPDRPGACSPPRHHAERRIAGPDWSAGSRLARRGISRYPCTRGVEPGRNWAVAAHGGVGLVSGAAQSLTLLGIRYGFVAEVSARNGGQCSLITRCLGSSPTLIST